MKNYKTLFVFFVVLALSCSSCFALAPLAAFSKASVEVPQEVILPTESEKTLNASTVTTTDSETSPTNFDALDAYLAGKKWLLPGELEAFKTEFKNAVYDVGQDIEDLKADLQKEIRTKFFVDAGLAFGFRDALTFGVVGDFGIRKGSVVFKVGGQYMIGDAHEVAGILAHDWSLANTTVQATIGFEF